MGVSRKQSMLNFPKNEHFLPLDSCTLVRVSGVKKCLFFWKFGVFCFLETPVWDSPFCLINDELCFDQLVRKKSEHYIFLVSVLAVFWNLHFVFSFLNGNICLFLKLRYLVLTRHYLWDSGFQNGMWGNLCRESMSVNLCRESGWKYLRLWKDVVFIFAVHRKRGGKDKVLKWLEMVLNFFGVGL